MKPNVVFVAIHLLALFSLGKIAAIAQTPMTNMVWIPSGTFVMGSAELNETPHTVVLTSGFYSGKYEVTQSEYLAVVGNNPSFFTTNDYFGNPIHSDLNRPVERVHWSNATNYCARLTKQEQAKGRIPAGWIYRLPTEAEWEYACRAGTTTAFSFGNSIHGGDANFSTYYEYDTTNGETYVTNPSVPSLPYPITVGSYLPNAWGLYDMHGNVWEWVLDLYGAYPNIRVIDPKGSQSGNYRVARGGGFTAWGYLCQSATRDQEGPGFFGAQFYLGFRVVLAPITPEWYQTITNAPPQPTYGSCPAKGLGKDSLVVVTHGRIPKEGGQTSPPTQDWLDDMVVSINLDLERRGLTNWQVYSYKWLEKAWTDNLALFRDVPLNNARVEGERFGSCIAAQGWTHVHLIAHSAGAALIQAASEAIKNNSPTSVVHTTFLDAHVGLRYKGRSKYGDGADWVDSYFTRDEETINTGMLTFTSGPLNHAYNVEITWLPTNKVRAPGFVSSSPLGGDIMPCYQTVTPHSWPFDFYLGTIPSNSVSGSAGFGFPLSKEGGNWNFATNQYPVGKDMLTSLGTPDPTCLASTGLNPDLIARVDLSKLSVSKSTTGVIQINSDWATFSTTIDPPSPHRAAMPASTPSANPAWLGISVAITNTANFISFQAQFLSTAAQGLLSVFWDTNELGRIDERVVIPGLREYTFGLPPSATNNLRILGFRLDSFAGTVSSVLVTNVTLGFPSVREPFSLSFTDATYENLPVLKLTGPAGYNYKVESSTNLTDWVTAALLLNTNGVVMFVDSASTNSHAPARFYRAVVP